MQKNNEQNVNLILERFKKAKGINTDKELSDLLEVNPSTISVWKKRNSLDYQRLFAKCHDIDINSLIKGEKENFSRKHKLDTLSELEVSYGNERIEYLVDKLIQKDEEIEQLKSRIMQLEQRANKRTGS